MLSNHLILCHPLLLLPSVFPSIRVFSNESALHFRQPNYWSFSISPSNGYIQSWFPLGLIGLISCCPRDSKESSLASQFKNINSTALSLPYGPPLTSLHDIALIIQIFVSKVMSLLCNMLSRFVIVFPPRSKCLLISWLWSPFAVIFWAQENKICDYFPFFFPSICHKVLGPNAMILVFWMLSFMPAFSLSSFTLINRLFSSSSLSAIRVVSSAYLRLLRFLPEILLPACTLSTLAFYMMCSAYKLNKQGDNIQPWHTPLTNLNHSMFSSNCHFLTCIQVSQEAGDKVVWSQFVVIHTVEGSNIVNEAVYVFLEFPCFFYDPGDAGNLILVPLLFLNPACTSGSSWFTYY